jgi:hypothetical protein
MRGSRRYPTPRGKGSCRGPDKLETLIGSIGAPPTIVHAVIDALAPFDIDNLDVPMTPLKVWTAIRGAARQACKRRTAQATSSRKEGKWTMSLTIEAIDRTNRPFFTGVASDCDLSRPLSPSDISSIHAGWTVSACCYSATSRSMTATRSTLTGVWGRSSKPRRFWGARGPAPRHGPHRNFGPAHRFDSIDDQVKQYLLQLTETAQSGDGGELRGVEHSEDSGGRELRDQFLRVRARDQVRRNRDGLGPDLEEEEGLAQLRTRADRSHGDTPMIDLSKLFDSYSRQARLFPGLLTLFPIILTAIAWFPRLVTSSWGATLVTLGTSCGLLYGLSVLSRSRGKKVEKRLLAEWGGWPTTIWLRHRDDNLPPPVRARYHAFFARNVPLYVTPTEQQEAADPKAADATYASAVKWLQERCRGKAFPLVEKENAEYGFRRNLRGLKPIGLTACFAALLISALAILWQYEPLLPAFASLSAKPILAALSAVKPAALGAICVDIAAIVGWLAIVRDAWVRSAGDQYARALLACCDTLDVPTVAKPSQAGPDKRKRTA